VISSLAELPFRERPVLELLNLTEDRDRPDPDYAGFGWARVARLRLEPGPVVEDALLLALHSADHGGPLELEFVLDDGSAIAPLPAFLDAWLPRLRGDERAIVLAMCNPHRALPARPASAGGAPLHVALGDVESWLDDGELCLTADDWKVI
jgi:hypothetical protein